MPRAKVIKLKTGEQIKDVDYVPGGVGLLLNVPTAQVMELKRIFGVDWLVPAVTDASGRATMDKVEFEVPMDNVALIVR